MKTQNFVLPAAIFGLLRLKEIFLRMNELDTKRGQSKTDDLSPVSGKRDSNPRPSAWEADALPTELLPQFYFLTVEIVGIEPTTSCMPCKRSSQLSYTPKIKIQRYMLVNAGSNIEKKWS